MAKVTKIGNDVGAVLSTCTVRGNTVAITAGQLDRKLYLAVNDVLTAIGGAWDRKAKAHVFPGDPTPALESVIEAGEVRTLRDDRQSLGWFPTPAALAAMIVDLADVRAGQKVLEPSAGEGAIAFAAAELGAEVTCIEIDPGRAAKLTKAAAARGDGRVTVVCCNFLDDEGLFDRIVMNPPFSVDGDRRADITHVAHAFRDCLVPGGRLVAIMSAGVAFREDNKTKAFRALVTDSRGTISPLPDLAFAESGTMVRTVVVTMNR